MKENGFVRRGRKCKKREREKVGQQEGNSECEGNETLRTVLVT